MTSLRHLLDSSGNGEADVKGSIKLGLFCPYLLPCGLLRDTTFSSTLKVV